MIVPRAQLAEALKITSPLIGNRRSMPVLTHVVLSAAHGTAELRATDLETGIRLEMEAQGDLAPVAIPHGNLKTLLRSLPKSVKSVTIDVAEFGVTGAIVNGVKMLTLPPDDFPSAVGEMIDGPNIEIPDLTNMLKDMLIFTSHDESRYAINGILLNFRDGELVATDGHRLAVLRTPARGNLDSVILHRSAANILTSFSIGAITTKDAWLSAKVLGKHTSGSVRSRLIEGQFPDYHQVVPKIENLPTHLTVDVALFTSFLKMVIGIANERTSCTMFELLDGSVLCTVVGESSSLTRSPVPGTSYTGPDMCISFNARYLMDCMEFVNGTVATLSLKNSLCPGAFYQDDGIAVVMPMRGDNNHKEWDKDGLRTVTEVIGVETEQEADAA